MKLIVCGSNSKGNSYILESSSEILLLEAGIRLREMTSKINPEKNVIGIAYTHSHQDHSKYIKEYAKRFGVVAISPANSVAEKTFTFGSFRVTPFNVYHDVPCFGYLIYHKEMGTMLFVTDTYAIPYQFKNVKHFLFEANYDDIILEDNLAKGIIDQSQYKRIQLSHMSLTNAIKALNDCDAHKAQTITLVHLSERNSNAEQFEHTVKACFGVPTFIAKKGLEVELTKHEIRQPQ